ncbi:integration host factor [Collinsella sp. AGMB00827]|uniref:Integration host factor n=1 Tax=Collinsella ureilytica TaxID=2869515 RepID=A0ABS7MLV3_9ACTN|nr:integration host factor, actinobacterial type [Collinsella urealyticum]MBY4798334.1 integration host factor [Collinsella urealyticum]
MSNLPTMTPEQREENRKKAVAARIERSEILAKLKAGEVKLTEVLAMPIMKRVRLMNVIYSIPGIGKVSAARIMTELKIPAQKRVKGLGAKQRERLFERLALVHSAQGVL